MAENSTLRDMMRRWRERGFVRNATVAVAVQFFAGLATGVGGNIIYERGIYYLFSAISLLSAYSDRLVLIVWSDIILVVGVGLFWLRGRFPIVYGTIEVVVGVVAATNVLARTGIHDLLTAGSVIQLLGGIYIIVRGLDNIGKGVKGTNWGPRWNKLFRAG